MADVFAMLINLHDKKDFIIKLSFYISNEKIWHLEKTNEFLQIQGWLLSIGTNSFIYIPFPRIFFIQISHTIFYISFIIIIRVSPYFIFSRAPMPSNKVTCLLWLDLKTWQLNWIFSISWTYSIRWLSHQLVHNKTKMEKKKTIIYIYIHNEWGMI